MSFISKVQSAKGFTLIELVVVITLIGIMAAGLVTLIDPIAQMKKARDVERKSDLIQIQTALELYRADNQTYPTKAEFPTTCTNNSFSKGTTVYLKQVPCDPTDKTKAYDYTPDGTLTSYTLYACLEHAKSEGIDTSNTTSCAANRYYYPVTNP